MGKNKKSSSTSRFPNEYRAEFAESLINTNINRMYVLSVYIIILQVTLNVINIIKPSGEDSGINIYVFLSLGTLALGIVFFVLLSMAKKGKIKSLVLKKAFVNILLYTYVGIQLAFCTLNIMSNGGVNSFIIAVLILCIIPVLRPLQSVLTTIGASTFVIVIIYFFRNKSNMWDSILITDLWTNLIIIVGLSLCSSIILFYLYRSNFIQSIELRQANSNLEVTVEKRTRELAEQTHTAQVASRSKSDFLARMSHEIRTPLNAIIGMTQIAKKTDDPEKITASIAEIETASGHLLRLLNDILDMSKIESGKYELFEEEFLMKEAIDEVKVMFDLKCSEKAQSFVTDFSIEDRHMVLGDKMRLKQILLNLLSNAVKFTPKGGRVFFSVIEHETQDGKAVYDFTVTDTGIGMSPEVVENLFKAFEQGGKNVAVTYGGTGLGLAISQALAEKMGGRIVAESKEGEGSCFSFSVLLPLAGKKEESVSYSHPDSQLPDFSGKRILIVEDVEMNSFILKELLAETSVITEDVLNGKLAVNKIAESENGYYDLVLMDIQMPEMDGYEATAAIRALGSDYAKNLPILAMTANAYRDDIEMAISSGMNGHLAKPIDIDEVIKAISQYLL